MALTDTLRRPVGPLPAWGWGVVIVGAYVVYTFLHRGSSGSTSPAPVIGDTASTGDSSGASGGIPNDQVIAAINGLSNQIAGLGNTTGGTSGTGATAPTGRIAYLLRRLKEVNADESRIRRAIAALKKLPVTAARTAQLKALWAALTADKKQVSWYESELGKAEEAAAKAAAAAAKTGTTSTATVTSARVTGISGDLNVAPPSFSSIEPPMRGIPTPMPVVGPIDINPAHSPPAISSGTNLGIPTIAAPDVSYKQRTAAEMIAPLPVVGGTRFHQR